MTTKDKLTAQIIELEKVGPFYNERWAWLQSGTEIASTPKWIHDMLRMNGIYEDSRSTRIDRVRLN